MSARKLRHYFDAHTIRILTNQSLNDIFSNRDSPGRISKWAMELSEHVVEFKMRSVIKSQILPDFVAKWMEPGSATEGEVPKSPWMVYYNGAWGATLAGAATILISPSGIKLRYTARLQFNSEADKCANNIAEYKTILLRCMVHHSQVLVNPSSTTIMIHTYLRVFDKLTLVTLCYIDVDEYIFMS
jgi:hypothetical protein